MSTEAAASKAVSSAAAAGTKTAASGQADRVLSIDVMRGFALIGMVMVHFMIFFGNEGAVDTWPYFILNHVLGDWGAACFLMMMGMSQVLSGRKHADLDEGLLFKRALIRGCYIFLVGLLMLALAWGPYQIWQWDILTLMGFCTILVFVCRKLPSWFLLVLVAALLFSTPLLRGGLNFQSVWGGDFMQVPVISRYFPGILIDPVKDYEVIWSVKDITQGFFLAGYFPVIPWSLFPLLGIVLGRRIVAGKMRRDAPWLVMGGICLAGLGLGLAYAGISRPEASIINGFVAPLSFYPDSFTMVVFQMGMAVAAFGVLFFFYDIRKQDRERIGPVVKIYNRTSGFSLTFYFMHYMLIGWTLAVVWFITGNYYMTDLMGAWPALLCGVTAVVLLETLLFFWEKKKGKYSLEWFLGMITVALTVPKQDRAAMKAARG